MNDQELSQALRALPRESAPPGFAAAVLRRAGAPAHRPRARRRFRLAAAALLVAGLATVVHQVEQARDRARSIETLEHERRALERELEEIKALAAATDALLWIEGEDEALLFDPTAAAAASAAPPAIL